MATRIKSNIHSRNVTLTRESFKSLMVTLTKAMSECALYDPQTALPKDLRGKYLNLYVRCIELYSDKELSKTDKEELAYLSYGVSITDFNFVQGTMTISFYRTMAQVEKKYIVHIQNEHGPYAKATQDVNEPEHAAKITRGYAMV